MDRHVTEEIDIRHDIPATESKGLQRLEKVLPTSGGAGNTVEHLITHLAATSTNGVMRAKGIVGDREDRPGVI